MWVYVYGDEGNLMCSLPPIGISCLLMSQISLNNWKLIKLFNSFHVTSKKVSEIIFSSLSFFFHTTEIHHIVESNEKLSEWWLFWCELHIDFADVYDTNNNYIFRGMKNCGESASERASAHCSWAFKIRSIAINLIVIG